MVPCSKTTWSSDDRHPHSSVYRSITSPTSAHLLPTQILRLHLHQSLHKQPRPRASSSASRPPRSRPFPPYSLPDRATIRLRPNLFGHPPSSLLRRPVRAGRGEEGRSARRGRSRRRVSRGISHRSREGGTGWMPGHAVREGHRGCAGYGGGLGWKVGREVALTSLIRTL